MPGIDWAGTTQLSWWELAEFIKWLPADQTTALGRKLNPESSKWTFEAQLLAAIATNTSGTRYVNAVSILGENTPPDWAAATYGPNVGAASDPDTASSPRGKSLEERKAIAERTRRRAAGLD